MADNVNPPNFGGTKAVVALSDYLGAPAGTASSPIVTTGGTGAPGGPLPAGTDRSGAVTLGGTAQPLAAANAARIGLVGENISAGDLWLNEIGGAAAVDTAGSYVVPSRGTFSISTNRAISIIGATTGQKFTATEF
jgi:hypothetical protein